jgi:RNA polymerase sigma-70 factor (ECF subfamily)
VAVRHVTDARSDPRDPRVSDDVSLAVAHVKNTEWARIVSSLIRITGDWSLAEDSAQDAVEVALSRWPADGIPDNPGAWITTTARNRAIDRLRRRASEAHKLREVAMIDELTTAPTADDRLELIFTCCHPALPLAARVALTLRTVAGLTTGEIARAFLVRESTMAQRLARATKKIANTGIPYRVPPPELLAARLDGVLAVLYLLFNEGYTSPERVELADSAIALADSLIELMPGESEPRGLLALMLIQHSRRRARFDSSGMPLTIEQQDRSLWDRRAIDRALGVLVTAAPRGRYVIQAQIAACHARATTAGDTDWRRIVSFYVELAAIDPSPVVELNWDIAVGMAEGPQAGLALLAELEASGRLETYGMLSAAQADLSRRAGLRVDAIRYYERAIELAATDADERFLRRRLAEVLV